MSTLRAMSSKDGVSKWLESLEAKVDSNNLLRGPITSLSTSTGQRKVFCFIGVVALVGLLLASYLGLEIIANIMSLTPVFKSLRAIKSEEKDDDTVWLTYWTTLALVSFGENTYQLIYEPSGVTFGGLLYWAGRVVFFKWLATEHGSDTVFTIAIEPALDAFDAATTVPAEAGTGEDEEKDKDDDNSSRKKKD